MAKRRQSKRRDKKKKIAQRRHRPARVVDNGRPIRVMLTGAAVVAVLMVFFMLRIDGETIWQKIQGPEDSVEAAEKSR